MPTQYVTFYLGVDKVDRKVYIARDRDKIPAVQKLAVLHYLSVYTIDAYAKQWTAQGYTLALVDKSKPPTRLCKRCVQTFGADNALAAECTATTDSNLIVGRIYQTLCVEHALDAYSDGWEVSDI